MERRREGLVVAIGIFKLLKAALLIVAGLAMLSGLPQELALRAEGAVRWTGIGAGRRLIERLSDTVLELDHSAARELAIFSLGYAAVFAVEGVGLTLRRRWAEWMTVFVTGSFIPLEIYGLTRHFGVGRLGALVVNVAVVVYLAWRRLSDRQRGHRPRGLAFSRRASQPS